MTRSASYTTLTDATRAADRSQPAPPTGTCFGPPPCEAWAVLTLAHTTHGPRSHPLLTPTRGWAGGDPREHYGHVHTSNTASTKRFRTSRTTQTSLLNRATPTSRDD